MKGLIFNVLEEVVTDVHGLGAWDDVLDELRLDGAYTAVGSYPDEELLAILRMLSRGGCPTAASGSAVPAVPDAQLLRDVGRRGLPLLAAWYPMFFAPHADPIDMLATVDSVIHCEVRNLDPGADVPTFAVEHGAGADRRGLVLRYGSARKLCMLAEGFALGVGDHYGQPLAVRQPQCMLRDHPVCRLVVTYR